MKKFLTLLLGFVIALSCFTAKASAFSYPNGVSPRLGDILVTSDAYSKGIVGHAGIVTGSDEYLEIRGANHYPEIRKLTEWFDYKGKPTKVVRINSTEKAIDAGLYARQYNGSKIPYKITPNLLDNEYTYCSKLVYQIYALGVSGVFPVLEGSYIWPPYNFLHKALYKNVTPRLVYSKGMELRGDIGF
ncbi:MAG: hypothetical protein E7K43_19355 [Bacillus subtilis]|nr:hypothetical protein [Bacillus subtilis]